jgi:hypothetical protein
METGKMGGFKEEMGYSKTDPIMSIAPAASQILFTTFWVIAHKEVDFNGNTHTFMDELTCGLMSAHFVALFVVSQRLKSPTSLTSLLTQLGSTSDAVVIAWCVVQLCVHDERKKRKAKTRSSDIPTRPRAAPATAQ